MTKTILGVLSLLVIMSCSIPVKGEHRSTQYNGNEQEKSRKSVGALSQPMTVVGAEVEGKVNWLVVGAYGCYWT